MTQGQDCRPAHQFGTDDNGACADAAVVQVNYVLQLPCGVDARRAVARDEPGGTGALPGARRQDQCVGFDPQQP